MLILINFIMINLKPSSSSAYAPLNKSPDIMFPTTNGRAWSPVFLITISKHFFIFLNFPSKLGLSNGITYIRNWF